MSKKILAFDFGGSSGRAMIGEYVKSRYSFSRISSTISIHSSIIFLSLIITL